MIPIVIVSYNNWKYVKNMIDQLQEIDPSLILFIMDNNSQEHLTKEYLKTLSVQVIYKTVNEGPWVDSNTNKDIYDILPERFILTDPDLHFNPKMPKDFIEHFVSIADKYKCSKVGMALDISEPDKLINYQYTDDHTLIEWEEQFWRVKIPHSTYELYKAKVDTTFCLVTKGAKDFCIRVAGDFTAKHIPWYKENPLYSPEELYLFCHSQTNISSSRFILLKFLEETYGLSKS